MQFRSVMSEKNVTRKNNKEVKNKKGRLIVEK